MGRWKVIVKQFNGSPRPLHAKLFDLRSMLFRILKELVFSFMLCVGERVLERLLFPGLHLSAGRMITEDPVRAESLGALVGEAFGMMAMIWLFAGSLHVIGWLYRRPLHWYVPPLIAVAIVALIFAASASQWYAMPR
jgi:hypothetical protein